MGQDETGPSARLIVLRRGLVDPKIAQHKGRLVKTTGDGILIEFPSVVEVPHNDRGGQFWVYSGG